ncbi:MAG: type II toxin-antitoxin system RelE/ParE family toxin [Chitinophaga sp.]|jgi:addiction module RelE/StbE family toxin|nr:type II toxin-antitoxin system RelE/ParE family toxin [Chitinophaga sp.]
MVELIWSPTAVADIENIAEYIGRDSFKAASNQVQTFVERAKILESYPLIGSIVPELKNSDYRQLLCGRYRIIYKTESEKLIYILTVHHQSRLLKNNPVFKKQLSKKRNK